VAEQLKIVIDADITRASNKLKAFVTDVKTGEAAVNKFSQTLSKPLVLNFDKANVQQGIAKIKSDLASFKPVPISVIPKVDQVPELKPVPLSIIPKVEPAQIPTFKPVPLPIIPQVKHIDLPGIKPIIVPVIPDVKPIPVQLVKPVVLPVIPDVQPIPVQVAKPIVLPVVPDVQPIPQQQVKPLVLQVIPEVRPIPVQTVKPIVYPVIPDIKPVQLQAVKPVLYPVIPDVKPANIQNLKPVLYPVIPDVKPVTLPTLKPVPLPVIPEFKEIPSIKPIVVPVDDSQVLKLSQTIETLQGKIGARKSFITVETDIRKIAAYNKEIQDLEKEVERLKKIGTTGFENFIVSSRGAQSLRTLQQRVADLGGGVQRFIPPAISAFDKLPTSISRAATALQRLPGSSNQATQAMLNLGRVVQDAPFGFLGIANNLNPLLESFQRLRASTGTTGGALKALGASLFGAGGLGFALSAVSSLLIVFGDRIFGAGRKVAQAGSEIKSVLGVISDSAASAQGDIAKVNALTSAFANTTSFEKQKRIIDELKKTNESYFGELKAGKSTYEDITRAANAYSEALVNQAVVSGLQNAISKLSEELGNTLIKYNDLTKRADQARLALAKVTREQATNAQGLTGQNQKVNLATNSYNNLKAELGRAGQEYGRINQRIAEFKTQIDSAVLKQLDLKSLVKPPDPKPLKDATDDILNRARQFVKEFGEIFVLPNLDDSFFTTKEQLQKAAKGLLDNVDQFLKGNVSALKLRIPVQTEFELIPVNENFITKELEEGFFKGLEKEIRVPINVIPDITLSK
jgi:hypothetical protein